MEFFKNAALLVVVIVLSYFTAIHFGTWYDKFSPQYDDSFFSLTKEELIFIVGLPFAYIFFLVLIFKSFALGNRNKWTGWLLAPVLLFFAAGDLRHIYIPIILTFIAMSLSLILNKILKLDHKSTSNING